MYEYGPTTRYWSDASRASMTNVLYHVRLAARTVYNFIWCILELINVFDDALHSPAPNSAIYAYIISLTGMVFWKSERSANSGAQKRTRPLFRSHPCN
jgi:hypothetical protein